MNIALVAPLMVPIPPIRYGGIERVIETLAIGLIKQGHQVTIYCAKESKLKAPKLNLVFCAPFPTLRDLKENRRWEIHQFFTVLAQQAAFDLIHFHAEPYLTRVELEQGIEGSTDPAHRDLGQGRYKPDVTRFHLLRTEYNLLDYLKTPFLVTFHNGTNIKRYLDYYRSNKFLHNYHYSFLSQSHRKPLSFFKHRHVIYNGIPVEQFSYNAQPKSYLLFVGRILPKKGILEAIEVAKATGRQLFIAAKVGSSERPYYEKKVKSLIDGKQIVFLGEVNFKEKVKLYKNAACLLFPIQWEEPFGLVMIEAMACGTPVIGFKRGSVTEIIKHGKNGFIVRTVNEMIAAVEKLNGIDRAACRSSVVKRFTGQIMVKNYETLYSQLVRQ